MKSKTRKRNPSGTLKQSPGKRQKCERTASLNGKSEVNIQSKELKGLRQDSRIFLFLKDNVAMFVTLLVTLMTFAARVHYVTQETSWWILHPDEIYQSLEVAHSEVYGYGFRMYEFLPPAKGGNLSLYQQREQQLGMHALRSPMYPHFYVIVSWIMGLCNCSTAYVVWRIAHVTVSSLLPLAAHSFASSLFRSRGVGAVAAILVASSVHLNVLGTHTLVHSFLAPVIFVSLGGLLVLLQVKPGLIATDCCPTENSSFPATKNSESPQVRETTENPDQNGKGVLSHNHHVCTDSTKSSNRKLSFSPANDEQHGANTHNKSNLMSAVTVRFVCKVFEKLCDTITKYCNISQNAPLQSSMVDENCNEMKPVTNELLSKYPAMKPHVNPISDSSGSNIPATDEQMDDVESSTTNRPGGSTKVSDVLKSNHRSTVSAYTRSGSLIMFLCSFCLAVACYIRPDTLLLLCALAIPYFLPSTLHRIVKQKDFSRSLVLCVLGGAAGILLGIAEDFHFYGTGIFSPLNWLRFNVMSNTTSQFFGKEPASLYLDEILFRNSGMKLLLVVNFVGFILSTVEAWTGIDLGGKAEWFAGKTRLLASFVCLLGVYSFQPHKELRFVHHVIVLYLVYSAANILTVELAVRRMTVNISSTFTVRRMTVNIFSTVALAIIIFLFSYSQWNDFPTAHDRSLKSWVYMRNTENYDVTKCLNFIASQNDVRGVFSNKHLSLIGGYTFLRHNVPVVTLTFSGYHEHGFSSRSRIERKLWLRKTRNISVVTSSKISNYFLAENTPYLLRHLLARKEYNYLVMDTKTDFLETGYTRVFRSGSVKVIKRVGTQAAERRLKDEIPFLKLEPKPDVLESEARQLHAFGLKELATLRYAEAQRRK